MPLKSPTTTPLPDEIYDEWAPLLGEAELKVLLYIVRRTLGFRKEADAISLTQFCEGIVRRDGHVLDRGCGIRSRPNVVRALKHLEAKGLIRASKVRTVAGDKGVTVYALLWDRDEAAGATEGGVVPALPWCRTDRKVVSEQHHRSSPTTPTTNSVSTNTQQDSVSTRAHTRAKSADGERVLSNDGADGPKRSSSSVDPLWQAVLDDLRASMTAENYAMWFAAAHAEPRTGRMLTVRVPTVMHERWLDTKLRLRIEQVLRSLGQSDIQIVFRAAS